MDDESKVPTAEAGNRGLDRICRIGGEVHETPDAICAAVRVVHSPYLCLHQGIGTITDDEAKEKWHLCISTAGAVFLQREHRELGTPTVVLEFEPLARAMIAVQERAAAGQAPEEYIPTSKLEALIEEIDKTQEEDGGENVIYWALDRLRRLLPRKAAK